jgi:hypothetical protein
MLLRLQKLVVHSLFLMLFFSHAASGAIDTGGAAGAGSGAGSGDSSSEVYPPTTLIGWANYVFKNRREYTEISIDRISKEALEAPLIPPLAIKRAIDAYLKRCTNPDNLGNSENWHTQPEIPTIASSMPLKTRILNVLNRGITEPATGTEKDPTTALPFVEQQAIAKNERIIFMGDLHGSVHSLLRNLLHIAEEGLLNNNFTLAPNVRLVVLGDMTDRGLYGTEVVYLLLLLKLTNWDNVTLIRGNHESMNQTDRYGFAAELIKKYGEAESKALYATFLMLCGSLPLATFFHHQGKVIQACHGGIEPYYSPNAFLLSGKKYDFTTHNIADLNILPSSLEPFTCADGFQWSDVTGFIADNEEDDDNDGFHAYFATLNAWTKNMARGGIGYLANQKDLDKYFQERSNETFQFIKIVRGHQDQEFCCKLVEPGNTEGPINWSDTSQYYAQYAHARLPGKEMFSEENTFQQRRLNRLRVAREGISFATMPSCITMTTAAEGRGTRNEGFGILTIDGAYEEWRYQIYQNPMGAYDQLSRSYPSVSVIQPDGSVIGKVRGYVAADCFAPEKYDLTPSHRWYMDAKSKAGVSQALAAKIIAAGTQGDE